MRDIRQGTDFNVIWNIKIKGGYPYNISEYPVKLYLNNRYGRIEVHDFFVKNDVVKWTFYGKDQKNLGLYSLTLVINEGEQGMVTIDHCNFVRIVEHSCQTGGEDSCNLKIEAVEIESTLGTLTDADTGLLNEILCATCSLDFNEDFSNDFTTAL